MPFQNPYTTLVSAPIKDEANQYYHGLPSSPVLVAHTGTTPWNNIPPSGEHLLLKELCPISKHPLGLVWEKDVVDKC
jgi:hypothetical protein